MNWKREAAEKLRDHAARKTSLPLLTAQIRDLKERAYSVRSASSEGSSGRSGNSREDRVLNNIAKRQELEYNLRVAKRAVDNVEKALQELDAEDRLVLERLYIYPGKGNIERLCEELNVEQATVYRYRERAIRNFTLRLYGVTET